MLMLSRVGLCFLTGILTLAFNPCNNPTMGTHLQTASSRKLDDAEKERYSRALSTYLDSILAGIQGFSGGILVAKNGEVLYERYSGYADGMRVQPVDPETPFHVASTSKTFTSVALFQLINAGKLSLDDSLQRFFPQFPYPGIRVRNLLNHSSGLPNYANLFPRFKWPASRVADNTDVLHLFYTHRPGLEFSPGSRFHYSNTNFSLLALIIEKVSGQSYSDYLRDAVFIPAGMQHSYVLSLANKNDYMPSWSRGGRNYPFGYLDAIYGDKNLYTTCRDLFKYDSALTAGLLLPKHWLDTAWVPNFQDRKQDEPYEYYGLGWRLKVFNDSLKIPYHNGWWHGNSAIFQRLVADTAVIIVTSNRLYPQRGEFARSANIFREYYSPQEMMKAAEEQKALVAKKRQPVRKPVRRPVTKKYRRTKR